MEAVSLVDQYLWNEQTDIVEVLCPEAFAVHEEQVSLWYEVKDGLGLFKEGGAAVIEWGYFAWLGLPHNRDIEEYLSEMLGGYCPGSGIVIPSAYTGVN